MLAIVVGQHLWALWILNLSCAVMTDVATARPQFWRVEADLTVISFLNLNF